MFENFSLGLTAQHARQERRIWFSIQRYFQRLTTTSGFNGFIMLTILINALVIGLETVEELKRSSAHVFSTLDYCFMAIYTLEFVMKLTAEPKGYWKMSYNLFDFTILIVSYVQVIMDNLNLGEDTLKTLRLLRAARALRTISFIEGLQVLVIALIDTIRKSVVNVVVLLTMLMVFFAVVGYYIFGYDETGDKERWGNLSNAMLTLFTFVTADGWTDIQKHLNLLFPYSQWFTVVFIFLGHFIFTNLFIGIIIQNIHEATERFRTEQRREREAILQLKKDYLYKRQHDDVKQMIEKQKGSQYANFQEMTKSFYKTLRHDDYVIMTDVACSLVWMETYLDTLDHLDLYGHRCQQAHFNMCHILAKMMDRRLKKQAGLPLSDDSEEDDDVIAESTIEVQK